MILLMCPAVAHYPNLKSAHCSLISYTMAVAPYKVLSVWDFMYFISSLNVIGGFDPFSYLSMLKLSTSHNP